VIGTSHFLPSRWSQPPPVAGALVDPVWGDRPQWTPDIQPGQLLPACHTPDLMLLMVERYLRDDAALESWAIRGKRCVEFVEGKQWSAADLAAAESEDRPCLTLNKIGALVRLVLGYHRQNRIDTRYLPTDDSASDEQVADVLTKVVKQISSNSSEPYLDTEVFMDGIVSGRGYYDWRLDYERNDFGEIVGRAKDPFTIRPDCDADSYDPDDWGHVSEARWVNLDEIEYTYGRGVSQIVEPLVRSSGYRGGVPSDIMDAISERTPWRTFGGQNAEGYGYGSQSVESYIANATDTYRKNIRLVEMQHRCRVMQRNIVDLETGDRTPVPTNFTQERIAKLMQWAAEQYASRGAPFPLRVEWRPTKRVRWTTMVGDIILYDDWSQYRSFTQIPYFPYFRRGQTRGMVDDLIDPQVEINKRASSEIDIITRTAFSGWMWHTNSLEESEKEKIENFGAAPGINIEWKGDPNMKPEQMRPPVAPTAMSKLEEKNTGRLKEIAGINDSALGQLDRVQSGRAIEARQRQSVLGIETYMDNKRRSKKMCGRKKLEMIQSFYTEPRLLRIQGEDGSWSKIGLNQAQAGGRIVNDVTIGRYDVEIDETPLSSTFLNAQFEEMMDLVEKGIYPISLVQDIVTDLSNVPQKTLLKKRIAAYMRAQGLLTADDLIAAQAQGLPVLPQQLAAPQPHGVPGKQLPPEGSPGGPQPQAGPVGGQPHGLPPNAAAAAPRLAAPPAAAKSGL